MANWHEMTSEEVLKSLSGNVDHGLTASQALQRLKTHGPNTYAAAKRDGVLTMILHQFRDVANIILLLAGVLSLALAIREGHGYIEPIVIFAIIIMNIALSVSQERSAERALEALQNLNSPGCRVLRDGAQMELSTQDVVPGDILLLKTGDLVAADARLVRCVDFCVDESALTGESEPVEKDANALAQDDAPLGDQINMVFSGCLVTAGNAVAVVAATGMKTQMGKIAGYLNNAQKIQTPLQKRLNKVSRLVSLIAIVSALILLGLGVRQGEDFWVMMLAAVSLAVAAVPEMLQLIVTLSLTHGVKLMVEQNALVRKLTAVETLGNTSVICSDKTGTLTQNRMAIQHLWMPGGEAFAAESDFDVGQMLFLRHLVLASNATIQLDAEGNERIFGDATETAIVRLMQAKGEDPGALSAAWERVGEIPFSSARKMMTCVYRRPEGGFLVLTKGAFDRLPFAPGATEQAHDQKLVHDAFAAQALRVICLASRVVQSLPADGNLQALECELNFEGFIGLIDPPRPEAANAIAVAKRAGVRTVMITGDHVATAKAIAAKIGLLGEGEKVITGQQLMHLDDEALIDQVRDYAVYARVSPEDKIRIVEAWQENGEVVSMTGDGVNDAPALKAADVGISMGIAGTEVAKSASDMVLTDDNFATIVSAVAQGRNVFSNIRKTLYFLLVCNLSEIVIMLGAFILGWGLPLTPVMLLLINVLGDGIPGLRLAYEISDARIMHHKPLGREESFLGGGLWKAMLQQTVAFSVVSLAAYYCGAFLSIGGLEPSLLRGQTMTFLVVAFTSILHIFTVRGRKSMFRIPLGHNIKLLYSVIAMLVLFTCMVLLPPLQFLFGLTSIGGLQWLIVLGLSLAPSIVAEFVKLWQNRRDSNRYKRRLVRHVPSDDDYDE